MDKTDRTACKAAVRRNGSGAYVLLVEDAAGVMWERASAASATELAKKAWQNHGVRAKLEMPRKQGGATATSPGQRRRAG